MAEKIVFAKLNLDIDPLIKSTKEVKKELDALKKEQKLLTKEGETSSKAFVENAAAIKILSTAYNNNVKAVVANVKTAATQAQANELIVDVLNQEVKTIQEAREQNKALNNIRNSVNATTAEGQAQIKQLNNALDANNDFIKENGDEYLKQKINIGNYTESVKGALGGVRLFGVSLNDVTGTVSKFSGVFDLLKKDFTESTSSIKNAASASEGLSGAQKLAFISTSALSGALKILRLALIATGIGAIVVVLGSLITFLATTQKGIDAVTSVTRPLAAVFQTLLGIVQQFGGDLFSDPLKALTKIKDFVVKQLVESFTGLGKIIAGIFTLDGDKIREGSDQIKKLANDNAQAIKDGINGITDQVSEAIKKGKELDQLIKDREKLESTIASRQAELNKALLEQRTILSDTGRTGQERVDAANEAERIQQLLIDNENQILDIQIQELKVRQSLNDTSREENKQLDELIAKRLDNQSKINQQEKQGIAARKKLQDESIQQAKEAADNALKQQQAELDLFIQSTGVRAKTLREQLTIDQEISDKKIEILKQELKNRNITQTEFDVQLLAIQNELLKSQARIASDEAQRELDAYVEANRSKIDSDLFFSEQSLQIEQERLNGIAEKRREFAQKQLDEGVINQTQFNDAINAIDNENRQKLTEAQAKRDEAQNEKEIIDLENKRILDQQNFETKLEADLANLEIQKNKELEIARLKNADETLIVEKFANAKKQIEQAAADAKTQANAQAFGQIAGFLGEETALGKAAALAQAAINIQTGITKALATKGFAGIVEGVLIAAKGAVSVAKISGVSTKFEAGGIQSVGGKRHSQGGTKFYGDDGTSFEAERGEGIGVLNRSAYDAFMNFNNSFGSGKSRAGFMEGGGIISRAVPTGQDTSTELLQAIQNLPPPIVTVEDIRSGNQSFVEVQNFANV